MKNILRTVFSILIYMIIYICFIPAAYADEIASGEWYNLQWTLDDNGLLTISGKGSMHAFVDQTGFYWPDVDYNDAWHEYGDKITKAVIMPGVSSIGNFAFLYTSLESISFPKSIDSIGQLAFGGSNLSNVYYEGTEKKWKSIYIGEENEKLLQCAVHFNGAITINKSKSGRISSFVDGEKVNVSTEGKLVTLVVTPTCDDILDTLTVTYRGTDISVTDNSFIMPNGDVTVKATFIHTPGEAVRENEIQPTCIKEGSYDEVVYCVNCHEELSREKKQIGKTAHTTGDPVRENEVAPTLEAEGSYDEVVYCSVCHKELSRTPKTIDRLSPEFTVIYDANGGTGSPESQTKIWETALTLSNVVPERAELTENFLVTLDANGGSVNPRRMTAARFTSYSFKGWNTKADGSGTDYAPGDIYTAEEDLTLYAQWEETIETSPVWLPQPTRNGYSCFGWTVGLDGDRCFNGYYMPDKDETICAMWVKQDLILPAYLTTIEAEAFEGGAFSYVQLPETTTLIGSKAFANCENLTYIYIPETTGIIARDAFSGVNGLTILGHSDSFSEFYAQRNGFAFVAVE